MGAAVGAVLPLGMGVALSPLPIIAVVLMLAAPRGRPNGPAFIAGWIAGLTLVGVVVLVISAGAGGAGQQNAPAVWVSVVKLLLGLALVVLAAVQWHRRPRREELAALPRWMSTIDSFGPGKAAGLGVVLSAVNPKNLLLVVAAAAAIAQSGTAVRGQVVGLVVFVVLGTLGPGLPITIHYTLGARSAHLLDGLRRWMAAHNTAIMTVLLIVLGVKLIGDGVGNLSTA